MHLPLGRQGSASFRSVRQLPTYLTDPHVSLANFKPSLGTSSQAFLSLAIPTRPVLGRPDLLELSLFAGIVIP